MVAGYDGPGGEPGDPQGILPPACVTPSLRPALPALGKPGDVLSLKPRGREEERRGAGGGRRNLSHTAAYFISSFGDQNKRFLAKNFRRK